MLANSGFDNFIFLLKLSLLLLLNDDTALLILLLLNLIKGISEFIGLSLFSYWFKNKRGSFSLKDNSLFIWDFTNAWDILVLIGLSLLSVLLLLPNKKFLFSNFILFFSFL